MNRLFLAGLLAVSLFFSCKNDAPTSQPTAPQAENSTAETAKTGSKKTILFFGNSLTAAYGLKPTEGFPAIIQQKLDSLGLDFKVVDAGVSGNTTADGKSRIDWVLKQQIDVFVLELGGNDALRGLPVADAKTNLQAIIDAVKTKNPNVLLVIAGMQAPPNLGKIYATDFKKMYPDLARSNSALLIPFLLEGVGGEYDLNQKDGIHPTAKGHKMVAENVWEIIGPTLQKAI